MSQVTTLSELRKQQEIPTVRIGFDSMAGFEALQRMAKLFNASSIVPTTFQGQNNLGNAAIALDMANRMGANPLMVMQNLYIVHGRPAWSAQFLIATLNQCGRFSSIRYEFQGEEGRDDWGCRAVTTELATGEKLSSPLVTIALAKKEGWYGKNGSKWQTMPELMLRYRAASWFVRAYAPEIAMGLKTMDEVVDTFDLEQAVDGTYAVQENPTPTISLKEMKTEASCEQEEKKAPARPTKEEMESRRGNAISRIASLGVDIVSVENKIGKAKEGWNTAQCAKAIEIAEQYAEQNAQTAPPASADDDDEFYNKHAEPDARQITCPKSGEVMPEGNCESCLSREGCPEWDL